MSNTQKGEFRVNDAEKQFELEIDNKVAFIEFYKEDGKVFMTHTEAPEELQGTGAAKELVKQALQYAKENKLLVVPSCSYVANYIDNNPEWRCVVAEGYQM